VAEKGIPWFTFHPVTAPVDEKSLFRPHAWSSEFAEIVKNSDGIIFFGGPDLLPPYTGRKRIS